MSAQSASVEYSQLEDVNPLADWVRDVQTFVPDYRWRCWPRCGLRSISG